MKNEKILLCKGEKRDGLLVEYLLRVDEIEIPDIRPWGLVVNQHDHKLIIFSYNTACMVHERILNRERNNLQKEYFDIAVPDLSFIAEKLPKQHRDEIVDFSLKFQVLVEHLLKKAKPRGYSYDGGKTKHGTRYKGYALVSSLVKED